MASPWIKRKMEVVVVALSHGCLWWLYVVEVWLSFKVPFGASVFVLMQVRKLGCMYYLQNEGCRAEQVSVKVGQHTIVIEWPCG